MKTKTTPQFYLDHGNWTDPREHASAFDSVNKTVSAITSAVQGLLVHDYFGAHLYSEPPPNIASASRATLPIHARLPTLNAFGQTPLSAARNTNLRAVGTCRDFALLTCSMLRHHVIPARVRCGFAHYFHPPTYEDHWICEYWDEETLSWKMADAQLDRAHVQHLSVTFDVNDMPVDQFVFAWKVWNACRNDFSLLKAFGHGEAKGFWFVRVNLVRDFLALMKLEVSNWDTWREQADDDKEVSDAAIAQCEQIANASRLIETTNDFDVGSLEALVEGLQSPHWHA